MAVEAIVSVSDIVLVALTVTISVTVGFIANAALLCVNPGTAHPKLCR